MKYFRLFRFGDQYSFIGGSIAAGIYLGQVDIWILWWAIVSAVISACGFAINELVDRNDVDRNSWNPVHVSSKDTFDNRFLWLLIPTVLGVSLLSAWFLEVFWWGMTIFLLWYFYSVPPFRWKAVPVLDLLTQVFTGIWLPFFAVLHHFNWNWDFEFLKIAIPITCMLVVPVFMYQLADYAEDKKNGLRPTHVAIGMNASIYLAFTVAVLGLLLFIGLGTWRLAQWVWVLIPFNLYSVYSLYKINLLDTLRSKVNFFQKYVRIAKPASWFFVPFFFWWWIVVR